MKTTTFTPIEPGISYIVDENDMQVGIVNKRAGFWCTRLDEEPQMVGCGDTRMGSVTRAHTLISARNAREAKKPKTEIEQLAEFVKSLLVASNVDESAPTRTVAVIGRCGKPRVLSAFVRYFRDRYTVKNLRTERIDGRLALRFDVYDAPGLTGGADDWLGVTANLFDFV